MEELLNDDSDDIIDGIQKNLIVDNSLDSDVEPANLDISGDDPDDDIPLHKLYDKGGLVIYSAEDLSEEIYVITLDTSLEIVEEFVFLDAEVIVPEEENVAAVVPSSKRKADDKVPFVSRLARSKLSTRRKLSYEFSHHF